MCGIFGKISDAGVEHAELAAMARALAHRGPDDEGFFAKGDVGIGNRRLAIIDVAGGHQPIGNEDGSVQVVMNGVIYNHRRLRRRLEGGGHVFRTRCDTEVIAHLYEELGERCVEQLRGMFALAIWDAARRRLLLARDRLGQKPLFYARDGGGLLFASEIKAILAVRRGPRELDEEALHHYLSLRFVPAPRTMLRGVEKLPPAHLLIHEGGESRIHRYWRLSFREKRRAPEEELLEELREKLAETVTSHLVSDVPVGAFLSGGMDSSMIVALMARGGTPLSTFAIGVAEQSFNELPYARAVAEHCGTQHLEETVEPGLVRLLPRMIHHLDEPSDPIAACMYHAARLASRHVKVVLGGDGGDELFAGFDRYVGLGWVDHYRRLPALLRRPLGPLLEHLPENFAYKSLTQKARWLQRLAEVPELAARYAAATCFFRFDRSDKQALYGEDLWRRLGELDSAEVIAQRYREAEAEDPLDRMLYADYLTRLPEHSLMLSDRMTMAHGLEQRSPLLDHELVELLAAFPARMKIRGRQLKVALRRLGREMLPRAIVERPKQGFMFPVAFWFRGPLYPLLEHTLLGSRLVRAGLLRAGAVRKLLEEHRGRRVDHHVRLWMLLNVELFQRVVLDGEDPDDIGAELQRRL